VILLPALVIGLAPVLLFLAALRVLDGFQLVPGRRVAALLVWGAWAALIALAVHLLLIHVAGVPAIVVRRAIGPVLEETLKAALIVALLREHRIGFMVDAAILGFAAGTGFALIENLYYAWALSRPDVGVWVARGLGTAILHGTTTALVGIITRRLTQARHDVPWRLALPGLALAIVVHALYNQLLVNPMLATAALLVGSPVLLVIVFERSERATREWLGIGLDGDAGRLEQILDGEVPNTPVGDYLESLRARFPGAVVADMLCLLRLHLELGLRAKGVLIARAAGVELPPDPTIPARLTELRHLERTIGPTGRLALGPLLGSSHRERWQIALLGRERT